MTIRYSPFIVFLSLIVVTVPIERRASEGAQTSQSVRFEQEDRVSRIPFRSIDYHIILQVTINDLVTVDMVLDTGFGNRGALLLDPEIGQRLGLSYVTQVSLGGGGAGEERNAGVAVEASLSLPGVRFSDQQLLVMLNDEPFKDWPAKGVIGGSLFDCIVEIDYESSVINLHRDALPDDPGQVLPVTFTHGIPVIQAFVVVDDNVRTPVQLIVDTGCNDPLLLFTYSDERIRPPGHVIRGIHGVLADGFVGTMLGCVGRTSRLEIGPFVLSQIITAFPDEASMGPALALGQNGMLGNEVLKRFTVTFDYEGGRIFLKPNNDFSQPFEFNMGGLVLQANAEGQLVVKDLIKDSPGEQCSIRQGDVIVAVNTRELDKRTTDGALHQFTQDGTTLLLTIERNSERIVRKLTLQRLI